MTATSGGKATSTADVLARSPTAALAVPVRELSEGEGIVLGFRQSMLEVGEAGGVDTGAGLGSDFVILRWGGRTAFLRGSEILRAWVATFAPGDAARFPGDVAAPPDGGGGG